MAENTIKVGRLAFRVEGSVWVAYWAPEQTTMEGATELARISMSLVQNPTRRDQFIGLMRDCFSDTVEETTGARPTFPDGVERAPENERAGRA